jgi:ACS family hexuronate transporter-like MFS transporter
LFFATTVNYIDRNALSVLKTTLEKSLGWNEADYGWIAFAFTTAYALFPSFVGRMIDGFGVKITFAAGVILWSMMAGAHAIVYSVLGFATVRFFLGAAETTNFPASIKTVSEWFPQRERALATGLFNCGSNVAVMISFVTVWIAEMTNWRVAFVIIGALGFIWLIFWLRLYSPPETHPRLTKEEFDYIKADQPAGTEKLRLHWTQLLRYGQLWPYLIGKFLTDPVWWFYLYWLPSYLAKERGKDPLKSALLLAIIYTGATCGSIAGGWFSGFLIKRGWKVGSARYMTFFLCAVFMPGAIVAYYTKSFYLCVALITLATGCHQGWSANIFTMGTDLFPPKFAGAITGLGVASGAIGGMFLTLLAGLSIQWFGNQKAVFIWAGLMHPLSLLIFWLWIGRNYRVTDVVKPVDMAKAYTPLICAGIVFALVGAMLSLYIDSNWATCVAQATFAGASGAMTASIGVILIGLAFVYAGLGKKNLPSATTA